MYYSDIDLPEMRALISEAYPIVKAKGYHNIKGLRITLEQHEQMQTKAWAEYMKIIMKHNELSESKPKDITYVSIDRATKTRRVFRHLGIML